MSFTIVEFPEQFRRAVDHQMLIGEIRRRIDRAQQLAQPQIVDRASDGVGGFQQVFRAHSRGFFAGFDIDARAELADVSRRYVAGAVNGISDARCRRQRG